MIAIYAFKVSVSSSSQTLRRVSGTPSFLLPSPLLSRKIAPTKVLYTLAEGRVVQLVLVASSENRNRSS